MVFLPVDRLGDKELGLVSVAVRPIGVLEMTDEGGGDEKIIVVPIPKLTQRYAHVRNYTDLPEITWRQIEHFFAHYKDLEGGKWVTFGGWGIGSVFKNNSLLPAPIYSSI